MIVNAWYLVMRGNGRLVPFRPWISRGPFGAIFRHVQNLEYKGTRTRTNPSGSETRMQSRGRGEEKWIPLYFVHKVMWQSHAKPERNVFSKIDKTICSLKVNPATLIPHKEKDEKTIQVLIAKLSKIKTPPPPRLKKEPRGKLSLFLRAANDSVKKVEGGTRKTTAGQFSFALQGGHASMSGTGREEMKKPTLCHNSPHSWQLLSRVRS